eukprot:m.906627 g.906627  ORF g.906627 m.906627 type:complete len:192 (+) comp60078_c0_seq16:1800-2375(+)
MGNQKVWVEVLAGYRLPCPPDCPGKIFEVVSACWREAPRLRPAFSELIPLFRWSEYEAILNTPSTVGGHSHALKPSPSFVYETPSLRSDSMISGQDVAAQILLQASLDWGNLDTSYLEVQPASSSGYSFPRATSGNEPSYSFPRATSGNDSRAKADAVWRRQLLRFEAIDESQDSDPPPQHMRHTDTFGFS